MNAAVTRCKEANEQSGKSLENSNCKSLLPRLVDPPVNANTRTVLYLFAGPSRENDLACHLRARGLEYGIVVRVVEVDGVRDPGHDLLRRDIQLPI